MRLSERVGLIITKLDQRPTAALPHPDSKAVFQPSPYGIDTLPIIDIVQTYDLQRRLQGAMTITITSLNNPRAYSTGSLGCIGFDNRLPAYRLFVSVEGGITNGNSLC